MTNNIDGTTRPTSRRRLLGAGIAAATAGLCTPAIASGAIEWRMVTSWPKNLPGPGVSAERLAASIGRLSGGRLTVKVYAAGELVPALECFDAVAGGTAEIAHTASLYWAGKMPSAPIFTSAPFGLTPLEHLAWIDHGGGQALWDELYAPHGIRPFMAGNTGLSMAGWFRREIGGLDDVRGLKIRIVGLGGEVWRRLGATPVALAPGEVFAAFQSGLVDAAELLAPHSDLAVGLHRLTRNYYGPGFDKPNGTGEALVSQKALAALPADLAAVVATACREEHALGLGQAEWMNATALGTLVSAHGVRVLAMPEPVLAAARRAADEILSEVATRSDVDGRVIASWRQAVSRTSAWAQASLAPFLPARFG